MFNNEIKNKLLDLPETREGYLNDFEDHINEDNVGDIIDKLKEVDDYRFDIELDDNYLLQNTIHSTATEDTLLLESRLFEDSGEGQMTHSFLGVYDLKDGEEEKEVKWHDEYIDDVWEEYEFTPWLKAKDLFELTDEDEE